jgi:hypothetical protein
MSGPSHRHFRHLSTACCCLIAISKLATAQASRTTSLDFATGSQFEDYLRVLQITGLEPLRPWSIRGFSPRAIYELAIADSTGPWALRKNFRHAPLEVASAGIGATFNSAYPYGANDGPVWAGRGLTLIANAGIEAHVGPFSLTLAPKAFRASNTGFELLSKGLSGPLAYNNGQYPGNVDYPQRFGSSAYSRLDPDASSVRFDSQFLSAGVSTANEWIGPATEYPFLLGDNAPGFPHIFIGTGDSWNLWFARLNSRVMWGKLYQSDYSPVSGPTHYASPANPGTVRLTASAQIVLVPRGLPGLELGFGRFLHIPYPLGGPDQNFWKKPYKVFFQKNERARGDTLGSDNQLASAYFRWVFPRSGFELYGERGYEDQFYDLREFLNDPDHDRAYLIGFQKTFRSAPTTLDVLKFEVINYQLSTLARLRPTEGAIYLHNTLRQGHTNRGQLLGASAGVFAAAASVVEWSRYSTSGRTSWFLRRIVRAEEGDYITTGIVNPRASDVVIAAEMERMRFGRHADFGAKVGIMQDLNRNFSKDVPNLNLQITSRLHAR